MKSLKLRLFLLIIVSFLNIQCNDDEGNSLPSTDCGGLALLDGFTYENAATNPYTITNAFVNEDCLVFNVSASGCDGSTWTMQLMDSENVIESDPPQRAVKLFLVNNEACLAVVSQLESFDLSALQIEGVNEIIINIDDYPDPVTYIY